MCLHAKQVALAAMLRSCWVRTSAGKPAILTKVSYGNPQSLQANADLPGAKVAGA
jgi:hypothetical protein